MRSINDYSEYLSALIDATSKDPVIRTDAKTALAILKTQDPDRYTLYRTLNGEIEQPEETIATPAPKKKVVNKETYIKEHPKIDVEELRKKARERLLKGPYGLGLRFVLPPWMTEEDLLSSVDKLPLSDLITSSGKLAQRETLMRRCIKIVVAEGRFDGEKLRELVFSYFCNKYHNGAITLKNSDLYVPIKRMLREEASLEELAGVTLERSVDTGKLVELINSKDIKVTDKDNKKLSRNARKKAKMKEKLENSNQ